MGIHEVKNLKSKPLASPKKILCQHEAQILQIQSMVIHQVQNLRPTHLGNPKKILYQLKAQILEIQRMVIHEVQNLRPTPLVNPKKIVGEISLLRNQIAKMDFSPFQAENSVPRQYQNFLSRVEKLFKLLKSCWSNDQLGYFKTHQFWIMAWRQMMACGLAYETCAYF